jgi:hypothetical protein
MIKYTSRVKVFMNFAQLIGQFKSTYAVEWPLRFGYFVRTLSRFVSFDFISLVPFECMRHFNFLSKVDVICLVVPFINLVYFVIWHRTKHRNGRLAKGRRSRLVYLWTATNYIMYLTVCNTLFMAIPCEEFDDGSVLLVADYSVSCKSDAYKLHFVIAVFGTFVFAVGVPTIFFVLLRSDMMRHDDEHHLDPLAFLRSSYRSDRSFTEPLVFLNKISVGGVLVFLTPNGSFSQIVLGIILAVGWGFFFASLQPFPSTFENVTNDSFNCAAAFVLIGVLALQTTTDQEVDREVATFLLWLVSLLPVAVLCVGLAVEVYNGDWRDKQSDEATATATTDQSVRGDGGASTLLPHSDSEHVPVTFTSVPMPATDNGGGFPGTAEERVVHKPPSVEADDQAIGNNNDVQPILIKSEESRSASALGEVSACVEKKKEETAARSSGDVDEIEVQRASASAVVTPAEADQKNEDVVLETAEAESASDRLGTSV